MSPSLNVFIIGNGVTGVTAARIIKEKNPETRVSIYTNESNIIILAPDYTKFCQGKLNPEKSTCFLRSGTKRKESTFN